MSPCKQGTHQRTGRPPEVICRYTVTVETEFTCLPDNPPHEYRYEERFVFDEKGLPVSRSRTRLDEPGELWEFPL